MNALELAVKQDVYVGGTLGAETAAELRRLVEVNSKLMKALEQIAQANHPEYPHFKSGTEAEFSDHLVEVAANAIENIEGGAA